MGTVQPYVVSGLREDSGRHIKLDVGAIFHDPDTSGISAGMDYEALANILDGWKSEGKSLGATTGGGNLVINTNIEPIETDGMITPVIGMQRMGAINVSLSTTIQEITKENIQRILPTASIDASGAIVTHNQILPEHYKTVVWAGTRNDGAVIVAEISGALQTNEINMNINTANTGMTIPVNFVGHAKRLEDMRRGAIRIWIIEMPQEGTEGAEIELQSMSVTDLRNLATEKNIDIPVDMTRKGDIVSYLGGKL